MFVRSVGFVTSEWQLLGNPVVGVRSKARKWKKVEKPSREL